MSKAGYKILDFGVWRTVRKGVMVNSGWLKWQDGKDLGMAAPGKWKPIQESVCTPHMGDARVKLEPSPVIPVSRLFV